MIFRSIIFFCFLLVSSRAIAVIYEVGPGKALTEISAVPWESLKAGDTVLIDWRADPYKEKWVICRAGTPQAWITVRGVVGPGGQLPVISGDGAKTRAQLNFWNEERSVIKIGGANTPPDTMPSNILIENLDIRSARPPYAFTGRNGAGSYINNAAAVYIEKGTHIIIRNCAMHDCGNGLFAASESSDVLIERCSIFDNGNAGSIYEHNNYTEANGIIFQFNHFGPLRAGCLGNNLKDRSAGLGVRYNWIESGNRQLDLVDSDHDNLYSLPSYRSTFVYGNILIEPDGAGNRQICHYGGDSGATGSYRKGTLYFYNNTVVSTRTDRTTLFRLSTNDEHCDCRNNIVFVSAGGDTLSMLDDTGVLDLRNNWMKPGWVNGFVAISGTINNFGGAVGGLAPGFQNFGAQNFRLTSASLCIDKSAALAAAALPTNAVLMQYVKHQAGETRAARGALDLGAYEYGAAGVRDWRGQE